MFGLKIAGTNSFENDVLEIQGLYNVFVIT
jgi:hypothetical protein